MKHIYRLSLFLLLLHCNLPAFSQTPFYQFSKTTASYNNLQAPTVLTTTMSFNYDMMPVPAGFKTFDVALPSQFKVGGNGWIVCTGSTRSFAFNPFLDGLQPTPATSIGYELETTSQDSILKIEWRNVAPKSAPASDSLNFQMWLYKKSQAIEFHYGPSHVSASPGPDGAVQIALLSVDFTQDYEIHSLTGNATSVKDSLSGDTLLVHSGIPTNGTVFRYTAPSLSVEENIKPAVHRLYPNPATDMIYTDIPGEARYYIINTAGVLVASGTCSATRAISTGKLASGIYIVKLVSDSIQHAETIEVRK